MKKDIKPVKAYKNLEFLGSKEARTVRMLAEYYEPKVRFEKNKITDTIVFFGSARVVGKKEAIKRLNELKNSRKKTKSYAADLKRAESLVNMARYYDEAVELSKRLTEWAMKVSPKQKRFTMCSGGGPGIMEAANKGAYLAKGDSIGLNISIPFEQFVNKYVKPELAFEFHYFFMRKLWFVDLAKALIAFPGGFGTLDELMEVITLIQTRKMKKDMKVIIYDSKYWKEIINFDKLVEHGMISKNDLKLFDFCDSIDEAFEKITTHFTKHYLKK
jgi:uncharacterized protein (TIGR00730 family)